MPVLGIEPESTGAPQLELTDDQRLAGLEIQRRALILRRPLTTDEQNAVLLHFNVIDWEMAEYMREGPPILRRA